MLELNRLYNMDCMEGMRQFPDKYFELAIVDPPYRDKNQPTKDMRAKGSMSGYVAGKYVSGGTPMKNKYIYIIVLLLTALICISIEIRHQTDLQRIDALTAENAALQQNIADMQSTVDKLLQNMQQLTKENEQLKAQQTKQPEAQKTSRGDGGIRYPLTRGERDLVERVVMAESGGESYKGQMLVCQCILNACEIDGIRPAKVIKKYVYAKARPEPSDSVKRAVSAVFDKGETVTDEPIVYFYAPGIVRSEFHESQTLCIEVGGHRFFKEKEG